MAKNDNLAIWLIAIVVIAMGFSYIGGIPGLQNLVSGEKVITPGQAIDGDSCPDKTDTATYGPMDALWNPGTSMSSENILVFRNSKEDSASKSDSATETLTQGDELILIYGTDSSTYYSTRQDTTVPCGAGNTIDYSGNEGKEHLLVANGSLTWNVFNKDTGNKNDGLGGVTTGTDNETIGAGDTGEFRFTSITTVDKTGFSPHGDIILTVELNKTWYDESVTTFGDKGPDATVPKAYEQTQTDSAVRAWRVSGCPDLASGKRRCNENWGSLVVTSETGQDPIGDGLKNAAAVGNGDIKVCAFDEDHDLHTITGAPLFGVEDDVGTISGFVGSRGQCTFLSVS